MLQIKYLALGSLQICQHWYKIKAKSTPHKYILTNRAALILFAHVLAVLECVCGLKEPHVGALILVHTMTKMLKLNQNLRSLLLQC